MVGKGSDYGVTFLLFTFGLHIRLARIMRPEVLGVGFIHLGATTALYAVVYSGSGFSLPAAFFIAIALSFSSTVATAKSLEDRNELGAYYGRIAMGILILQDIVAVVLLAFMGIETPSPWAVLLVLLPIARIPLARLLMFGRSNELILLFGLALALGTGFLFEIVGLSPKLGALIASVMLADHDRAHDLYDKLWGIKEVFL